jgi:hypothetical protein
MANGTAKTIQAKEYVHITKSRCHQVSFPSGPYVFLCFVTVKYDETTDSVPVTFPDLRLHNLNGASKQDERPKAADEIPIMCRLDSGVTCGLPVN